MRCFIEWPAVSQQKRHFWDSKLKPGKLFLFEQTYRASYRFYDYQSGVDMMHVLKKFEVYRNICQTNYIWSLKAVQNSVFEYIFIQTILSDHFIDLSNRVFSLSVYISSYSDQGLPFWVLEKNFNKQRSFNRELRDEIYSPRKEILS